MNAKNKEQLREDGYVILDRIFKDDEISHITGIIERFIAKRATPEDSPASYAIRSVFQQIPALKDVVLTPEIKNIIGNYFGNDFFLVRSVYFNKPSLSNWFVAWHQDISIHVANRSSHDNFLNWTKKDNHIGVQPPVDILTSTFTVRIHLDDCDETNGALKVISGSHRNGITRFKQDANTCATVCPVAKGGIMIMQPLLFHASGKNISGRNRRVLHMEFCNKELPAEIGWAEKEMIF